MLASLAPYIYIYDVYYSIGQCCPVLFLIAPADCTNSRVGVRRGFPGIFLLSCLALSKCKYHPCPFHGTELRVFVVCIQANVFSFLSRTYLAPLVYSFSGGGQSCATIQQSGCHCGHKNTSLRSTGEAALRSYFAGGAY